MPRIRVAQGSDEELFRDKVADAVRILRDGDRKRDEGQVRWHVLQEKPYADSEARVQCIEWRFAELIRIWCSFLAHFLLEGR